MTADVKLKIFANSGEMMIRPMVGYIASHLLSLLSRGNAGKAWQFVGAAIFLLLFGFLTDSGSATELAQCNDAVRLFSRL